MTLLTQYYIFSLLFFFLFSTVKPFWPTGSGCARGFLGAFDAAWMMKRFAAGADPVSLLEEREAILYLLPQTTPERLQKNLSAYTIDPKTRYTSLSELVPPGDVTHLYDTDDPDIVNALKDRALSTTSSRRSKKGEFLNPVAYNYNFLNRVAQPDIAFSARTCNEDVFVDWGESHVCTCNSSYRTCTHAIPYRGKVLHGANVCGFRRWSNYRKKIKTAKSFNSPVGTALCRALLQK